MKEFLSHNKISIVLVSLLVIIVLTAIIFRITRVKPSLEIISGNSNIGIFDELVIQTENLDNLDKIELITNPSTQTKISTNSNNISIKPVSHWVPQTQYSINLVLDNKIIYSFKFESRNIDSLSEAESDFLLVKSYENDSSELNNLYNEKPWLKSLPIINSAYIIIYDYSNEKIRIRLLNTDLLDSTEIKAVQAKAEEELESIDLPENTKFDVIYDESK